MNPVIDKLSRLMLAAALILAASVLVLFGIVAVSVAVYFVAEPRWGSVLAALTSAAFIFLSATAILLLARGLGRRRYPVNQRRTAPETSQIAAEIGRSVADLMQSNAKEASMVALGAGVILGLSPRLRRKLLGLLR